MAILISQWTNNSSKDRVAISIDQIRSNLSSRDLVAQIQEHADSPRRSVPSQSLKVMAMFHMVPLSLCEAARPTPNTPACTSKEKKMILLRGLLQILPNWRPWVHKEEHQWASSKLEASLARLWRRFRPRCLVARRSMEVQMTMRLMRVSLLDNSSSKKVTWLTSCEWWRSSCPSGCLSKWKAVAKWALWLSLNDPRRMICTRESRLWGFCTLEASRNLALTFSSKSASKSDSGQWLARTWRLFSKRLSAKGSATQLENPFYARLTTITTTFRTLSAKFSNKKILWANKWTQGTQLEELYTR